MRALRERGLRRLCVVTLVERKQAPQVEATTGDVAGLLRDDLELPVLEELLECFTTVKWLLADERLAAAERFVRRDGPRPEVNLEPALVRHLLGREYPANVRDLARVLREAIAASRDDTLRLTPELEAPPPAAAPAPAEADTSEVARIRAMLDRHHWRVTDAAAALGVTCYALARAIKKHGLRDAH